MILFCHRQKSVGTLKLLCSGNAESAPGAAAVVRIHLFYLCFTSVNTTRTNERFNYMFSLSANVWNMLGSDETCGCTCVGFGAGAFAASRFRVRGGEHCGLAFSYAISWTKLTPAQNFEGRGICNTLFGVNDA